MPAQHVCGRSRSCAVAGPAGIPPDPRSAPYLDDAEGQGAGATVPVDQPRALVAADVRLRPMTVSTAPCPASRGRCCSRTRRAASGCVHCAQWDRCGAASPGTGPRCARPGGFRHAPGDRCATEPLSSQADRHERAAKSPTRSDSAAASTRHAEVRSPAVVRFLLFSDHPARAVAVSVDSAAASRVGH